MKLYFNKNKQISNITSPHFTVSMLVSTVYVILSWPFITKAHEITIFEKLLLWGCRHFIYFFLMGFCFQAYIQKKSQITEMNVQAAKAFRQMDHLRNDRYAKTSVLVDWGKWVIPLRNKPCLSWVLFSPDNSSLMSSAVTLTSIWVLISTDLEWI